MNTKINFFDRIYYVCLYIYKKLINSRILAFVYTYLDYFLHFCLKITQWLYQFLLQFLEDVAEDICGLLKVI